MFIPILNVNLFHVKSLSFFGKLAGKYAKMGWKAKLSLINFCFK
jgi:hypothetical protein